MMERDFAKDVVRLWCKPLKPHQNPTQKASLLMKCFHMNQIPKEKLSMKANYISVRIAVSC